MPAGLSNLTSLSFKRSKGVTAEGMRAFANLINLVNLDLEGCLKIHGGLIHLKGLLWSSWISTTFWVVSLKYQFDCLFCRSEKAGVTEFEILQLYCGFRYHISNRYQHICLFVCFSSDIAYGIKKSDKQIVVTEINLFFIFNLVNFLDVICSAPHPCKADNHLYFVDLTNLKDLQLSCCRITDLGVSYLRGKRDLKFLYQFGGG